MEDMILKVYEARSRKLRKDMYSTLLFAMGEHSVVKNFADEMPKVAPFIEKQVDAILEYNKNEMLQKIKKEAEAYLIAHAHRSPLA